MASSEYLNNKTFETLIIKFQQTKIAKENQENLFLSLKTHDQNFLDSKNELQKIKFEFEQIQEQLAAAFYTLSQNIVRYAKFNLIDQDDAIQESVMVCFEKVSRFDPKKGKAFNYSTTVVINHLRQQYRTARNYNELKRKYLDHLQLQQDQHLTPSKSKSIYKKHNIVTE